MKIGVIGCGGRIKKIIELLLAERPNIEIKSMFDPSEKSIRNFRNSFGEKINSVEKYVEVAEDPEIEWVLIGSINYAHKDQILACLDNRKNVFSEKPVAISIKELKEIQDKFKEKGKSFLVSYPLRYSPHYKKIKDILESGKIGDVISFEFNEVLTFDHGALIMADWRRLEKFSGGHLLEKCCHDFDVINLLIKSLPSRVVSFGGLNFFKPENQHHLKDINLKEKDFETKDSENPFFANKDVVDNQVLILEYRNGARALFHTNCASTIPERRIYICGTKGTLRADVLKGILQMRYLGSTETITVIDDQYKGGHGAGDVFLVKELIEAMEDEEKDHVSLDDGIKSAIVALAAEESRKEDKIVDLEPIWKDFGY
jgi:predicted dehydrogenase